MIIFLMGMMGSGKSYFGKQLAAQLSYNWIDLDHYIEEKYALNITTIFNQMGEEKFRLLETECLKNLPQDKPLVVSTGGGTPCYNANINWMNQHGLTIWLDTNPLILLERLENQTTERPLLNSLKGADLLNFLVTKNKERLPFYGQAKYHIVDIKSVDSILISINNQLNEML